MQYLYRKTHQDNHYCQQASHAEGFYRNVFKKFKGTFERIFFTRVSPVTLDDLTSGFNIGWNISTIFYFDKMPGFSTEEVREMFTYYKNAGSLPADYNKLKNLIRLDKLDGDRKGISTNYAATCSDIYMRRRIIIKR